MKAIIFDFDGTLADTLPLCFYAFQAVFKTYDNLDISSEAIKSMFGPSETGIIRENLIHTDTDQAIELYYKLYEEEHNQYVIANDEIKQLLLLLKNKDYKLGIYTGKAQRSLEISLKALEIENLFDSVVTGDDVRLPKPHPEGVHKVLDELEVDARDAIFLGDSDADILAGQQAGVFSIGVPWLPEYQTLEFTNQPDKMIYNVNELINYLENRQ